METKTVMVLGQTYRVKGLSYREYIDLSRQVISKSVSPVPDDDFTTLQLFMVVMQLTAESMTEIAKSLIRSVSEKPKGVI